MEIAKIKNPNETLKNQYILRAGIASIWLATGFLVFHPHYREVGSFYLSPLGMNDWIMYLTCAAEVVLGLWILLKPMPYFLTILQTGMILVFTIILAVIDPTLLVHPLGMLTKNLPILGCIWGLWYLQKEGWTERTTWTLRVGMAVIWITEGLFPKVLFQQPWEVAIVKNSNLYLFEPATFLMLLGIAQALSGVIVLLVRGKLLLFILIGQTFGVIILPLLVSYQNPLLWVHPFGPMTKNFTIIAGTIVLIRHFWLERKEEESIQLKA